VPWVEVFAVLVVSHAAGDFLLQTDWQATHKGGGLNGSRERRRALAAHVLTYSLAFVPALIWLAGDATALGELALLAGIALPHAVIDDGRLLGAYVRTVKHVDLEPGPLLMAIDQSVHLVLLFALALAAGQ
jgi:Protein of unknown function (DUF3307)